MKQSSKRAVISQTDDNLHKFAYFVIFVNFVKVCGFVTKYKVSQGRV